VALDTPPNPFLRMRSPESSYSASVRLVHCILRHFGSGLSKSRGIRYWSLIGEGDACAGGGGLGIAVEARALGRCLSSVRRRSDIRLRLIRPVTLICPALVRRLECHILASCHRYRQASIRACLLLTFGWVAGAQSGPSSAASPLVHVNWSDKAP
jgi:hypothetical protein